MIPGFLMGEPKVFVSIDSIPYMQPSYRYITNPYLARAFLTLSHRQYLLDGGHSIQIVAPFSLAKANTLSTFLHITPNKAQWASMRLTASGPLVALTNCQGQPPVQGKENHTALHGPWMDSHAVVTPESLVKSISLVMRVTSHPSWSHETRPSTEFGLAQTSVTDLFTALPPVEKVFAVE